MPDEFFGGVKLHGFRRILLGLVVEYRDLEVENSFLLRGSCWPRYQEAGRNRFEEVCCQAKGQSLVVKSDEQTVRPESEERTFDVCSLRFELRHFARRELVSK
jgi:hypothetical protein